jgi:hypothetical protein
MQVRGLVTGRGPLGGRARFVVRWITADRRRLLAPEVAVAVQVAADREEILEQLSSVQPVAGLSAVVAAAFEDPCRAVVVLVHLGVAASVPSTTRGSSPTARPTSPGRSSPSWSGALPGLPGLRPTPSRRSKRPTRPRPYASERAHTTPSASPLQPCADLTGADLSDICPWVDLRSRWARVPLRSGRGSRPGAGSRRCP